MSEKGYKNRKAKMRISTKGRELDEWEGQGMRLIYFGSGSVEAEAVSRLSRAPLLVSPSPGALLRLAPAGQ